MGCDQIGPKTTQTGNYYDCAAEDYNFNLVVLTRRKIIIAHAAGVEISWVLWFQAAILPGIISLMITPAIIHWLYPPTLTETPQATKFAKNELKTLGPMSQNEKILLVVFLILATTWATSFIHGISTLGAALSALSILLLLGVLHPKDISGESAAWGIAAAGSHRVGNLRLWYDLPEPDSRLPGRCH